MIDIFLREISVARTSNGLTFPLPPMGTMPKPPFRMEKPRCLHLHTRGDLDVYTHLDIDEESGNDLTHEVGYDGGAFFSRQ